MFRRLPPPAGRAEVTIRVDGRPVTARADESVAAALLAAGYRVTRRAPVGADPRAPFCMMGVCFECVMEIDGQPGRQACLVAVEDGLEVRLSGLAEEAEP